MEKEGSFGIIMFSPPTQMVVENAKSSMDVEVPLHYNIFSESTTLKGGSDLAIARHK